MSNCRDNIPPGTLAVFEDACEGHVTDRRSSTDRDHKLCGVKLCRPSEGLLNTLLPQQHGPFVKEAGGLLIDANGHWVSVPPQ